MTRRDAEGLEEEGGVRDVGGLRLPSGFEFGVITTGGCGFCGIDGGLSIGERFVSPTRRVVRDATFLVWFVMGRRTWSKRRVNLSCSSFMKGL